MQKRSKKRKFGRTSNERKQLLRNLVRSLALHGFINTTAAKAASTRRIAERLVTVAKEDTLTSYRHLMAETGSVEAAKLLMEYGKLFKSRPGGYLRTLKIANQAGDNSLIVRLEWVEKVVKAEAVTPVKAKKEVKEEKKTEVKKEAKVTEKKSTKKAAK